MAEKERDFQGVELGKYIVVDPHICDGKPTVRGTQVLVHRVVKHFSTGETIDEVAVEYRIPPEAVEEALDLAAEALLEKHKVPYPEPIVPTDELVKLTHAQYRALWPKEKYKRVEISKHIVADPFICHGKPTARGTRVLVHICLRSFSRGEPVDELAADYNIPPEAVIEGLHLAAEALLENYAVPYPEPAPMDERLKLNPTDSRIS